MARRPTRSGMSRASRAVASIAFAGLALAACSSGAKSTARGHQSAQVVADQAVSLLGSVTYTEVNGSVKASEPHKKTASITVTDVVAGHSTSKGEVTIVGNPAGSASDYFDGSVRYIVSNQITWVKGSTEFWRTLLANGGADKSELDALVPKLTSGWVELITASTSAFNTDTAGLIDPQAFAEEFLHDSAGSFVNKGNVTVGSRDVVELATKKGAIADIAASGEPYPVKITTAAKSSVVTDLNYSYPSSEHIAPPKRFRFLNSILEPYEKKKSS